MNEPLRCVLRLPAWETHYNGQGGDDQVCARCNACPEKTHLSERPSA